MAKRITDTSIKALVIKDKEYTYTVEEGFVFALNAPVPEKEQKPGNSNIVTL
ncbi:MAG: hypothetical protein ACTJHE_11995 [Vibrio casei]